MSPAIKLHRFVPSSSVEFWLRSTPGCLKNLMSSRITSYLEKSGFGFYVIHILCSFWKMLLSFCVLYCLFSISLGNGVLAFPSFRRSGVCK
ncbi:hypothetical protein ERO13_A07G000332v2 [Gossypium hirsutum]|nr:hypothetical protein ERO13_A07G000332v2 [Gossypium hirsutum]